jgi:predicted aldo/keto reductase-like oxidoreductase
MPLNVIDYHHTSFQALVLPVLVERNIGVLGMKPLASGRLPKEGTITAEECLRYALSLPTSVVITGCENARDLEQALRVGDAFSPLSRAEMDELQQRATAVDGADGGKIEGWKTTEDFDGTVKNPHWMTTASVTA